MMATETRPEHECETDLPSAVASVSLPEPRPQASLRACPDLTKQTTLLLCRHGESVGNKSKRFQGCIDLPLSEVGRQQARCLAECLRRRNIAALCSSPLARAHATAETIASSLGVSLTVDQRLMERHLGRLQGQRHEDIRMASPDIWRAWKSYAPLPAYAKAEPEEKVIQRLEYAFFELATTHPGATVAVVLHGANSRCLLKKSIGNASITTLKIGPGQCWRIDTLGDASHLPRELAEDSIKASKL